MTFEMIQSAMKPTEQFCNLLFKYHTDEGDKFTFKNFEEHLPGWMNKTVNTEEYGLIKKHQLYFPDVQAEKLD